MTVRGYVRVSTGIQAAEGYSLAAQKAKINAWANYQDANDVEIYEDAGISGTRDDRPGLTALLLDLQPGDTVVTYALSRLARGGAVQLLGIVRDIRARDARVVFLQENIDTETSTGRLMLTILAALAELEIEQTRERTDMGRTQAALEGIFPHSAHGLPIGYTTDEEGRLVEDKEHSDTVRLIFQQGQASYKSTADLLNSLKVPSKRGGRWREVQVRRVVLCEAYSTGQYVYRASTRPDEPEKHIVLPSPKLVTEAQWQAAQRDARVNHHHKRPELFPLTGHLRCKCGARLAGRYKNAEKANWKSYHLYCCFSHVRKQPICPAWNQAHPQYDAATLHAQARALVADLLTNPSDPAHIAAAYGHRPTSDAHELERQDIQRKLDALLDLYLEGVIPRQTYDERRNTLTYRLNALAPAPITLPVAMPRNLELAHTVQHCSNEELAELLDMLNIEFIAPEKDSLKIVSYVPLG